MFSKKSTIIGITLIIFGLSIIIFRETSFEIVEKIVGTYFFHGKENIVDDKPGFPGSAYIIFNKTRMIKWHLSINLCGLIIIIYGIMLSFKRMVIPLVIITVLLGISVGVIWFAIEEPPPPIEYEFPELEISGGIPVSSRWELEFVAKSDSYIYFAVPKEANGAMAGVYFGRYPGFRPNPKAPTIPGRFAGRNVSWQQSTDRDYAYSVDTLVPYRHSPKSRKLLLHVWVRAKTEADFQEMLNSLAAAKLQDRAPKK